MHDETSCSRGLQRLAHLRGPPGEARGFYSAVHAMTDPSPALPQPPVEPVPAVDLAADRERWSSAELLGDRTEVLIVHGNEVYRLRRTRQDKLILYK